MSAFEIDSDTIRTLASLMVETGLLEIELAEGDRRVRVSRAGTAVAAAPAVAQIAVVPSPAASEPQNLASLPGTVASPMVGTAYLQPEPGAPRFVDVGDTVRVGDTLLIIEAMKVMNPIKAPRAGQVTQILISDGQPVEYGEPLMVIE